jgi:hypothetical protein
MKPWFTVTKSNALGDVGSAWSGQQTTHFEAVLTSSVSALHDH